MAQLGHSAWIRIPCPDMPASVEAWSAIGFDPIVGAALALYTDGQRIIELIPGDRGLPSVVYGNASPARTAQQCKDRGAPSTLTSSGEVQFGGIGLLQVFLCEMPIKEALHNDGEQNPLLGYHDHLVVHVDDLDACKRRCEAMGLLVLDQMHGEKPSIDVTDGAVTLSLRTLPVAGIPIEYSADIDELLLADLRLVLGDNVSAVLDDNGEPVLIRLTMPEGTCIIIGRDE